MCTAYYKRDLFINFMKGPHYYKSNRENNKTQYNNYYIIIMTCKYMYNSINSMYKLKIWAHKS